MFLMALGFNEIQMWVRICFDQSNSPPNEDQSWRDAHVQIGLIARIAFVKRQAVAIWVDLLEPRMGGPR